MAVAAVGLIGNALGWSALTVNLVSVGIGLAASAIQRRNAANSNRAPGISTETATQGEIIPQNLLLGRTATAGHLKPAYSNGQAGSVENAYRYRVIELADHPISGVTAIWLGDRKFVWPDDFDSAPGQDFRSANDTVHEGKYQGKFFAKVYDGTQTTADAQMLARFGSHLTRPWTAQHIGFGVAYVILAFVYDEEVMRSEPQARIECAGSPLYDPTQDTSVGGSGAQRFNDPATWAATENPVVMIYNLFRGVPLTDGTVYGLGLDADALPHDNWAAAIATCDALVGGVPRYRAGLDIPMKTAEQGGLAPLEAIDELLKACDGELVDVGGTWRIRVGEVALPSVTITDRDILATRPQSLEPLKPLAEKVNTVRGTYVEPENVWQPAELPLATDAAQVAEDGEMFIEDIALSAVPYAEQGQRLIDAWRKDALRNVSHVISLGPEFSDLNPLESIAWNSDRNGYVGKVFEIVEKWDHRGTFGTTLALRERDPGDYTPGTLPAYVPPVATAVTRPVQALPGAAVEPFAIGGSLPVLGARYASIKATWTPGLAGLRAVRWIVRRPAPSLEVVTRDVTYDVAAGEYIIGANIEPSTDYEVQLTPIINGVAGVASAWLPVTTPAAFVFAQDIADDGMIASTVATTPGLYPDGDMRDARFYTAETGSFTLETTTIGGQGVGVLTLPDSGASRVVSKWQKIDRAGEYTAQVRAWLFSDAGVNNAGTVQCDIELASRMPTWDGTPGEVDPASIRALTVAFQADGADTALQTLNFATLASETVYRFAFEREALGLERGRFAEPNLIRLQSRDMLTDDARVDVDSMTEPAGAVFPQSASWVQMASLAASKKTSAAMYVDLAFDYNCLQSNIARLTRDGAEIRQFALPATTERTAVARRIIDSSAGTGPVTYALQVQPAAGSMPPYTLTHWEIDITATHTGG